MSNLNKVNSKTDKCPECGSNSVMTELNLKTGRPEKHCLECDLYFKEVNND